MKRLILFFLILTIIFTLCSCGDQEEKEQEMSNKVNDKWSSLFEGEEGINYLFAVDVWNYIFAMKIDRDDLKILKAKEIAVRLKIESLAGRIKTGQVEFENVKIYPEDIKKAFRYLDITYIIIADMKGNGNGETEQKELDELGKEYIDQLSIFLKVRDKYGIK
jgi:hypothetical protein